MAYTRQIAVSILIAAEAPINEHLIKLLVLTDDKVLRHHWLNELAALYERIEDIRPVPQHRVFWDCLFADRFPLDGQRSLTRILTRLARQHEREITLDPATVLKRLRQFHEQCCALLAKRDSPQRLFLELEPKPFEMLAVTTSVVDCGLGGDQENRRRAGLFLHQPQEVVRARPEDTLYFDGGQFCFVDRGTGLIEFCMLFKARVLPTLGESATQVRLWARTAPSGLTSDVFFDEILGRRFASMVSDAV